MSDDDDALDDLAESYLAADPDLTAGFADDAGLDDAVPDGKGPHRLWSRRAATASGWQALGHGGEPGSDVRHDRAAWWDHAVQSGRSGRAARSSKARGRLHPADAASSATATAPAPAQPLPPPRPAEPDRPVKPQSSDGIPKPDRPDPQPAPRPPRPAAGGRARRRARGMVGAVALAVVLVVGGVVAFEVASHDHARSTKAPQSDARNKARIRAEARLAAAISRAATWVVAQVDHTAKVACDPMMCQALADHGLPDQGVYQLDHEVAGPSGASILVDTATVRRQFGAGAVANWAPTVLASFGVGADQIMVRLLAPHGAPAYEAALRADTKQRQLVGTNLLTSSQITTTTSARNALAAGNVDDRLLLVITALASQHPIDIVAFSQTWPGATTGIPMRCAYLAVTDPAAYLTEPVYVQAMIGLLRVQPPAYRPGQVRLVSLDGRKVLSIWYAAPSPLGVISPSQ
ncbi:MAG TPA: hypothetical protein VEV63_08270 [Streptosporangiaceae bacterium]|nr:hypothetical protein [Streptosporangiaceae bacterium]